MSESGVDVFDPRLNLKGGNFPLGNATASSIALTTDGFVALLGSETRANLYVLRLLLAGQQLNRREPDGRMPTSEWPLDFSAAVYAGGNNPISFSSIPEMGGITGILHLYEEQTAKEDDYHRLTSWWLVSLREIAPSPYHWGAIDLFADVYQVCPRTPSLSFQNAWGVPQAYLCNDLNTNFCDSIAPITPINGGVLAMTGSPASVTFVVRPRL